MPTLLTTCIILLFSVWVWNLKSELGTTRSRQLGVVGETALVVPGVVDDHHVALALPKRPVAHAAHESHATKVEPVRPRGGVIPTWTIG